MRAGKGRVQLDAMDGPVLIGGTEVSPGDLLLGDADGVVAVPRSREVEVVALAKEIEEAEDRIRTAVENGMRLDEARKQFKYFELQRRKAT